MYTYITYIFAYIIKKNIITGTYIKLTYYRYKNEINYFICIDKHLGTIEYSKAYGFLVY